MFLAFSTVRRSTFPKTEFGCVLCVEVFQSLPVFSIMKPELHLLGREHPGLMVRLLPDTQDPGL